MPSRFSPAQIDQISRTVRRTPEVMVKVTGGGTRRGAVAAHFAYISRHGALEIETDEGGRIGRPDEQKRLLDDWHLELTAGQYRRQGEGGPAPRPTKLVHNIVLCMPAPTHPDMVLAAARKFARQKFVQHRYAMILHTPRAVRGENKSRPRDAMFSAQRYGESTALRDRVIGIAKELSRSKTLADPARRRLLETRESLVSTWMKAAEVLDAQGEMILAGDVRYFAGHLPPVLTDRQRLAAQLIRFTQKRRQIQRDGPERGYPNDQERTR